MTFGLPTSSSVAQAWRLSEERVVMSKSISSSLPTPLLRQLPHSYCSGLGG
jgi:hypothetical protein